MTLRFFGLFAIVAVAGLLSSAQALAQNAYITNTNANPGTVSVIDTATLAAGGYPVGVAVTPDGSKDYVTTHGDNTVSVIATATNMVVGPPILVGSGPLGLAVTPDGSKVYIANSYTNTVSVILT